MNKLLVAIVVILVLYTAVSSKGCHGGARKSDTTIVHDTTWSVHDSLIYSKPKPAKIIHDTIPPQYLADTNYARLKIQYDSLLREFFALKTYYDTVRLDTLGYVSVIDSVQKNGILGRSFHTNYKIPTITNTVTIQHYEKPKAKVFIGGGIDLSPSLAPTGAHGGLLLNKTDGGVGTSGWRHSEETKTKLSKIKRQNSGSLVNNILKMSEYDALQILNRYKHLIYILNNTPNVTI